MKTITNKLLIKGLASLMLFHTACKKEKKEQPADTGNYVLAVRAEGSSTETTDYIVQSDNLDEGTVSTVGTGIEQKGFRFYERTGNTIFSITYQNDNIATGYHINENGDLVEKGNFSIARLHLINSVDDRTTIAASIPRNGSRLATFYLIDADQLAITKEVTTDVFDVAGNGKEQAYFSGLHVRGDKLFAPYFMIENSSFNSNYTDSACVAIYSYPEMKLEKVIRDNRTGPIGVYAGRNALMLTENGDMYSFSPTAIASGAPKMTRPSGILRIKNGSTDFDQDYFFNVEEVTGGYKLAHASYIGNGKMLGAIYSFTDHVEGDKWTQRDVKLAVLDVNAKTVKYVEGVPVHQGGPYSIINIKDDLKGKLYVKIKSSEGVYIYDVNIDAATATRGTKIEGADVFSMYKM